MQRLTIRPRKGWQPLDLAELWSYRELFGVLAQRDFRVRYKQTILGVGWALLQPLATMVLFTMIGSFGGIPTDGVAAPIFYYAGMLPWLLFANAVNSAGNSLNNSHHLITKVYFPRLIVPVASAMTTLADFAVSLVLLLILMVGFGVAFRPQIALVPLVATLAFVAALSVGFWLSALTVRFRDVRHIMPFLIQIWLFATPVIYPSSVVKAPWKRMLMGLNPMSGVVDAFRWCVLGRPAPGPSLWVSVAVIAILLVTSLYYFRRLETSLADRI